MRLLCLLTFSVCILASSCSRKDQTAALPNDEMTRNAKRDANACATALKDGDYKGMVQYMPAKLSNMLGGAEGMRKMIEAGKKGKDGSGMQILETTIGEPGAIKKDGERHLTLVPQTNLIKVTGGRITGEGWLLGISDDGGRNWVFVDSAKMHDERFKQVFPELAGKMEAPSVAPPTFEED